MELQGVSTEEFHIKKKLEGTIRRTKLEKTKQKLVESDKKIK